MSDLNRRYGNWKYPTTSPMPPCVIYRREEEVGISAEGGEVCTVYIMRINRYMHLCALNPARLAESFVSEALYGRYHWHSLGKDNKKEIPTFSVQDHSFRKLGQDNRKSSVV